MTDIERDAARYRWIKAAQRLRIDRMPDSHFWISETGERYSVSHSLCAFDTGFSGLPTLDDLIDQAMDMYPIAETDEPAATAPPADGQVAELVAWLQEEADDYKYFGCEDSVAKCNRAAELLQWQAPVPVPVAVSERLPEPNVKVLAHYFNSLGNGRTICAIWVPAKTRSDSYGNDDFTEYDEEADIFYWPEGWYEAIENWDDLGWVKVDEGEVVYWQPLPKWPAHALPLPEVNNG